MRNSTTPPRWADKLVAAVCTSHSKRKPALIWKRSVSRQKRRRFSHGHYSPRDHSITIFAGYDPTSARLLLLHELAHAMAPLKPYSGRYSFGKKHRSHDKVFWAKAWKLYAKYGVPIEQAKATEFWYMAGAKRAYYKAKPWKQKAAA